VPTLAPYGSWASPISVELVSSAGRVTPLELPYTSFYPTRLRSLASGRLATFAASSTEPTALVLVDPDSGAVEVVRRGQELDLDPAYLSVPRPVEFPTEGGQTAHALYYPPTNPDFEAAPGERPPLLVVSHGGPTDQVVDRLSLAVQFFTSRGFAVADVDYGGSTGYGRAYRERLNGNWGVVDTLDCINAARQLAAAGEVDGERLAIRGGSAAATPPCARSPSTTPSRPARATTAWPTWRRWPATPTSSSRAIWTA